MGCDLVPCQRVNVGGRNTGAHAIDRGLLRISNHSEYLLDFGLQGTYRSCAREVAPVTVDASCQFDQHQIAVLQAPPGRAIELSRAGAVGAGLNHGPPPGMKYAIAANLPIDG